jgi:iron complex transport system permease protein
VNFLGRDHRRHIVLLAAVLLAIAGALVAISVGAVAIPLRILPALLLSGPEGADGAGAVLWAIRLPRVLLALLVGATLAVAGAALQGVFRNPLADPALIGVSSGASLGAALCLVLGPRLMGSASAPVLSWVLPVVAFGGALLATLCVLAAASSPGRRDIVTMLLTGIAVTALAQAGTGLLVTVATDAQLRSLSFWTLGSLGGATWETLVPAAVPMLLALVVLPRYAASLDLLLLGDAEAAHLGIRVTRVTTQVIVLAALGVGAAVAASGLIGFVGLVVPHAVRLVLGPSHRGVLPVGMALGAAVLVIADTVARTVVAPIELPIGVVTALLGAPLFLWMVVQRRDHEVTA